VTRALPWLLDELERHRLTATFFVEGINCELYPDALREIAVRGHELGHHGWSHERWSDLAPEHERDVLVRGVEAYARLGLRVCGFRPPGGALTDHTPALLRAHGFDWCSPEGHAAVVDDKLAYIPFDWELVDAYHLMDSFDGLRAQRGDRQAPRTPAEVGEAIAERLIAAAGLQTLIFHPFLMLDDAWAAEVSRLLGTIADLVRARRTWAVPGQVFADWQLARS
jgi:hypothetical protein